MKKIALLSVLVLLTACQISPSKNPAKKDLSHENNPKINLSVNDKSVSTSHPATTSGIGEVCGGTEKTNCHQGLTCVFDYDSADGHGTCLQKSKQETACEPIYQPVCGLKNDRQKFKYFNKCEMEKNGATFLNEGECKFDEKVAKNCQAIARGFGDCYDTTVAYEFNGSECVQKVVPSCNKAEVPFTSMQECESTCVK